MMDVYEHLATWLMWFKIFSLDNVNLLKICLKVLYITVFSPIIVVVDLNIAS
jgi:hypothetical protein